MPSLITTCEELYDTQDLYAVLGVDKKANAAQIKKAYHKKSLVVHPDRAKDGDRESATRKFQCIGAVYAILSDENKRGLYDETGEVDDENDPLSQNKDWEEYWRCLFPKVTMKDIEEFEKKYKESDEEKEDIKKAYLEGEGDMGHILDTVLLCEEDDEERFREIIDDMIKNKEIKKLKGYKKLGKADLKKRKLVAETEAQEAEEAKREMGLDGSDDSLRAMILARQQSRGQQASSFLDGLAAKYGGSEKKKGTKKKKN